MNRSDIRLRTRRPARLSATAGLAGLTAAAMIVSAAIAGCGTGQIAQTTDQSSAVNGTEGVVGDMALRDVRMQAVQTGDVLDPGRTVDLVFAVSNQSLDTNDELTRVSTEIGKVSLTGDRKLPVGGKLIVSPPATPGSESPSPKELRAVDNTSTATATVTLDKPISNGLTYDFTFDFKHAGQITLAVPISADDAASSAPARPRG